MNPEIRSGVNYDLDNREGRRKKGQRSGYKLQAKLPKKGAK